MNLITGRRVTLRQVAGLHIALHVILCLLIARVVIPGLLVAIIRQLFEFAFKSDHVVVLDKTTKLGVGFVLHDVNDLCFIRSV